MRSQNKYLPRTGQSLLFACALTRVLHTRGMYIGLPTEIFDRLPASVNLIHNNGISRRKSLLFPLLDRRSTFVSWRIRSGLFRMDCIGSGLKLVEWNKNEFYTVGSMRICLVKDILFLLARNMYVG